MVAIPLARSAVSLVLLSSLLFPVQGLPQSTALRDVEGRVFSEKGALANVWLIGLPGAPVTGDDGSYSASIPTTWSGSVEPHFPGYHFEPSVIEIEPGGEALSLDFEARERKPGFSRLRWVDEDSDLRNISFFSDEDDLVLFLPGQYSETSDFGNLPDGVTLLGVGGAEQVVIRHSGRAFLRGRRQIADGLTFEAADSDNPALWMVETSGTRLRNCRFRGTDQSIGLRISDARDVLIEGSDWYQTRMGLLVEEGESRGDLVIRQSTFLEQNDGISVEGNPELGVRLENTRVIGQTIEGVEIRGGAREVMLDHVVFHDNRIALDIDDVTFPVDVRQAVFHGQSSDAVQVGDMVDLSIYDTIFSQNTCSVDGSTGTVAIDHSFFFDNWICSGPVYELDDATLTRDVDPRFTDVVTDNFTLSSISPARGVGRDGQDIGAYGGDLASSWTAPPSLTPPELQELVILDSPRHLEVSAQAVFRAEGHFAQGYAGEVGPSLSWSSSDPDILRHLGDGAMEASAPGTVDLTAEADGQQVMMSVEVHEALPVPPSRAKTESRSGPMQNRPSRSSSPTKALPEASGWALVDPLEVGRGWHTVTLLTDGRVLVTGGNLGGQDLSQTEIFDPSTGRWQVASPMSTVRRNHSATLLGDGRVLVVGGWAEARLSSAEIYDPRTDQWSPAPGLARPRASHGATLLSDGTVLVFGGDSTQGSARSSTELYDPVFNEWHLVGSMPGRRGSPSAVRLLDGRVFSIFLDEAEIYDPASFSWDTAAPPPRTIDALLTATLLLDGRVLVTGGSQATGREALIYDPEADVWLSAGLMAYPRQEARAVLLADGRVLVVGGSGGLGSPTETELFDPTSMTWQSGGHLSTSRRRHALTLLHDGRALLVAGQGPAGSTARCEVFQPPLPSVGTAAELFEPRYDAALTELADGRVMVAGGRHSGSSARVEIYDPVADAWSDAASLGTAGDDRTAILLPSGEVLVVGSYQAELWSPVSKTWRLAGPRAYPEPRSRALLLASGKVLAVNGAGTELFDPEMEQWRPVGSMVVPRTEPTLTLLPSGEVLAAGGVLPNAGGNAAGVISSAEIFDPITETWRETDRMSWSRRRHVAALLVSGEVLVAGGDDGELVLAESEIYSPQTGFWRDAGAMTVSRRGAVAVGLPDGRIWVTGGSDGQGLHTSSDVFEPAVGRWRPGPDSTTARERHVAARMRDGGALVIGGLDAEGRAIAEVERLAGLPSPVRPQINSAPGILRYGESFAVEGSFFGGGPQAHGGSTGHSAANHPVVRLQSKEGGRIVSLVADPRPISGLTAPSWYNDPMTLTFSHLPPGLDPGFYDLTVWRAGVPSLSQSVLVECSLALTEQPRDATVALGEAARFEVAAEGARRFQWRKDGVPIEGATSPWYVTPVIGPDDAGAVFDVLLDSGCRQQLSNPAILSVLDTAPPSVEMVAPAGGEIWLLPLPDEPAQQRTVVWDMSDDIRICRAEVALEWQTADGGWLPVENWPQTFDSDPCEPPGLLTRTTTVELRPDTPPSGQDGSRYRIRLRVRDLSGLEAETISGPFSIIRGNPENIRTLVVTHSGRLEEDYPGEMEELFGELSDLIGHAKVSGFLMDLADIPELQELYDAWRTTSEPAENVLRANELLFGRGEPGTSDFRRGIHSNLRQKLDLFVGVKYLVIVGGDAVIPMARMPDGANLWGEHRYTSLFDGPLEANSSPVAQALGQEHYLSDDLLAQRAEVGLADLERLVAVPDLAVGRLVETPAEIGAAIRSYLEKDGGISLAHRDRQVFVAGYDFLTDSSDRIADHWRSALGVDETDPSVGDALIGNHWLGEDLVGGLCERAAGGGYGIFSLNGHATHFQEGIPNPDPTSSAILGIEAADLRGASICEGEPLMLDGALVYSVGCHGGLSIPDRAPGDPGPDLDLPQTYLAHGAAAYLANSGFGWGLEPGVGYSERLVELFSRELTNGEVVSVGRATRLAKAAYFRELRHFDPYHQKTLMQWTLFGLPMYALRFGAGQDARSIPRDAGDIPVLSEAQEAAVRYGAPAQTGEPPPEYLVVANVHLDLQADGLYQKHSADGSTLDQPGCASLDGVDSCYWTMLGVAGSGSAGTGELPLEPYLVYETGLANASQHGVLWLGGRFLIEEDWRPTFPELVSNGSDGQGAPLPLPQYIVEPPTDPVGNLFPGDPCRGVDETGSNIVVTTGESGPGAEGEPWARHRRYVEMDMEIFYLAEVADETCDREGPVIGQGPFADGAYHQGQGATVRFQVPVTDSLSGVWRVVALVDESLRETATEGRWIPVELELHDGSWQGELDLTGAAARYFLQAVDRRGNVSWRLYDPPESREARQSATGIDIRLPEVGVVELERRPTDLSLQLIGPGAVTTSALFEYRIWVRNLGQGDPPEPIEAGAVTVDLVLPEGAEYYGLEPGSEWQCDAAEVNPQPVQCRLSYLPGGGLSEFLVGVYAPPFTGLAEASAEVRATAEDPNLGNNRDTLHTVVTQVQSTDLEVSITNGRDVVAAGQGVGYRVRLLNRGPADVDRVFLHLDLSELEEVSTPVVSQGRLHADGWWDLSLPSDAEATVEVSGRIPDSALGETLEAAVRVWLPSNVEDPDGENDFDVDSDPVIDPPPRIEWVDTVAGTPGDLPNGSRITVAVTQLLLGLSEAVTGAELPEVFGLISPGTDGIWQTDVCGEVLGDDIVWETTPQWLESEHLVSLELLAGPLPKGSYRWQVCSGLFDLTGQALEDAPWSHEFRVEVDHLLSHPNFDHGVEGWQASVTGASTFEWTSRDAADAATSGSLLAAGESAADSASLEQCAPLGPAGTLGFSGKIQISENPGSSELSIGVDTFATPDCSGEPLSTEVLVAMEVPTDTDWTTISRTLAEASGEASSAQLRLRVEGTGSAPWHLHLDDLALFVDEAVFRAGFEMGDTSEWDQSRP